MDTDFSTKDKACSVVCRRPRQGITNFCELCSPRSPKSNELASTLIHLSSVPIAFVALHCGILVNSFPNKLVNWYIHTRC